MNIDPTHHFGSLGILDNQPQQAGPSVPPAIAEPSTSTNVTLGQICPRAGDVVMEESVQQDHHSFSRPGEYVVEEMHVSLTPDFESKKMQGTASYKFKRLEGKDNRIILDCKGLKILYVVDSEGNFLKFFGGRTDPLLGYGLTVVLPREGPDEFQITYETSPSAEGLYWNSTERSVYSHSQPTYTRSWLPCQDTPSVRVPYTVRFNLSEGYSSLVSCQNNVREERLSDFDVIHKMDIPLPSYLMAFAVSKDYTYRATGPRTGIYASTAIIDQAYAEFSHLETILEKAEEVFGPYGEWQRYDMLIVGDDFPASATENPCLTFYGPAILSGNGENLYIVLHEIAHSWFGNMTTAASWEHLWLNEGLTSYGENRITESVQGEELAALLLRRNHWVLTQGFETSNPEDQRLRLRLKGKNPRDSFNDASYYKGLLFFKMLERHVGRADLDAFLKKYVAEHKFKSVTTEAFEAYLRQNLLGNDQLLASLLKIKEWLYEPELPDNVYLPESTRAVEINAVRERLLAGCDDAEFVEATKNYGIHEWRFFMMGLSGQSGEVFQRIDRLVNLKENCNLLTRDAWLWASINAGHYEVFPNIQEYILRYSKPANVKRYVAKLVEINTPESLATAQAIYDEGIVKFSTRAQDALRMTFPVED
jgi:hypothetical protein